MRGEKLIYFDAGSLLKLLVHYSDGKAVPLDAEMEAVGIHPVLQHYILLRFKTAEPGPEMAQARYEGKKVMVWSERGTPVEWKDGNETPR